MTTEAEVEEFLSHFGVKGMHWGVRKKVRGSEGKAQRAERVAERRPTRGNVRSAQRLRKEADRRNQKGPVGMSREDKIAFAVIGGAVAIALVQHHNRTNLSAVRAVNAQRAASQTARDISGLRGSMSKGFNPLAGSGRMPGSPGFNPLAGSGRMPSGTVHFPKAWPMPPGARPMGGPSGFGKIPVKDLKPTGPIPSDLMARAQRARNAARNGVTPASLGIRPGL